MSHCLRRREILLRIRFHSKMRIDMENEHWIEQPSWGKVSNTITHRIRLRLATQKKRKCCWINVTTNVLWKAQHGGSIDWLRTKERKKNWNWWKIYVRTGIEMKLGGKVETRYFGEFWREREGLAENGHRVKWWFEREISCRKIHQNEIKFYYFAFVFVWNRCRNERSVTSNRLAMMTMVWMCCVQGGIVWRVHTSVIETTRCVLNVIEGCFNGFINVNPFKWRTNSLILAIDSTSAFHIGSDQNK